MLLAIDTATKTIGLAVHDGNTVLAEAMWAGRGHHTIELAPEISLMLKRIGVSIDHLTAIGVAAGPGSFTGLRIGMALAKGLALAHKLDMVGIPTHEILARVQPPASEKMVVLIRAGRNRFTAASYRWEDTVWAVEDQPENISLEELDSLKEKIYLCGELNSDERGRFADHPMISLASPALCVRRPAVLAELAWQQIRSGSTSHPANLVPVYIKTASGL